MEACYINTGHPDFLNGHKAMGMVTDAMNANKQPAPVDPKNPNKSLQQMSQANLSSTSVDSDPGASGFFGSFFAAGGKKQKKGGAMEPVSVSFCFSNV